MGFSRLCIVPCFLAFFGFVFWPYAYGQMVPAIFIFGDSVVDFGNNNAIPTVFKANFPPYGRDFPNRPPTGRFCNGKLVVDFLAEIIGLSSYPPPYLSTEATGNSLLNGANFASAASGYYEPTSEIYQTLSLRKQLSYYRAYQARLEELLGTENATTTISGGIHILSTGTSDYLQNYYISPLLHNALTANQFSTILVRNFAKFVQELYDSGARKIGVTSLPPIGCLPAAITLFGCGNHLCVHKLNYDAYSFNKKLISTALRLRRELFGLNLVVFDIYKPLIEIIKNPVENGFAEVRKGCCGAGLIETSILCNKLVGACYNASEYVFWDAFHPSEAANSIVAQSLFNYGTSLLG